MAKPIALATGDWHVRKHDRVWSRRDTLCGDTAWSIKQICEIADTYDVPYVILLGDLFEQKLQQSDALQTMRSALDTFQQQGRKVLYVQGQHERSTPPLLHALHLHPLHINEQLVEIPGTGLRIYGLDYKSPNEVRAALEAVPEGVDILATHQVWMDFMGEDRGDAWFHWAKSPRCILTGDFHVTIDETRGQQRIISPGSICMQNIGEPHTKNVFILNDDLTAEAVQLHTRGYYEARINDQEDLDAFIDSWRQHPARIPKVGVPASVSANIIRVWYREDVPEARERIEARVTGDAHLFLKAVPVESAQVAVDTARRVQVVLNDGLAGCIREFYAEPTAVCEDAVSLAGTRDIQTELLRIYKDRLYGTDSKREATLSGPAG